MNPPTFSDVLFARRQIRPYLARTPLYSYPAVNELIGTEVFIKHENYLPVGAFKVRGGINLVSQLSADERARGVIAASTGNHGQSIGFAARQYDVAAAVVVPLGNSTGKNAAMRALGVEVIEKGHDFQAAAEFADEIAKERGWHRYPSFHPWLVRGVGTYALELFKAVPDIDTVYVPVGLASGLCGVIAARDALGRRARVVAVVSAGAPAFALSYERGEPVSHEVTTTIADGMACRTPDASALAIARRGVERVVQVTDDEVKSAMRALFSDTHNVAEGAGAAALAALLQDKQSMRGRTAAIVLTGGNVDSGVYAKVITA